MLLPFTLILAFLAHQSVLAAKPTKRYYSTHNYYVLEHNSMAGASLDECAQALGVEVIEQAGELRDHWVVRTVKPPVLSKRDSDPVLDALESIQRRARSHTLSRSDDSLSSRRVADALKFVSPQVPRQRIKRAPPPIRPGDETETAKEVAERQSILDPEFSLQWHLVNDDYPQHMMNVTSLWAEGITGKGVISAMVDDGLDYNSDDLAANFDAEGSYDFNIHVDLPTPTLFDDHHGTRCAGQIAAVKNDVCGVGIAYDSKVAGIRILSGPISDIDEAAALNYGFQNSSIYSCSWGPPDDGRSMEGPGYLIKKAIVNGIQNGRGGKGSVFVFASGNGGRNGDQCNFDGYTNSIYSVTVAAVDWMGLHPDYSEACAANMIVAYSSGDGNHIVTTDVGKNKCSHSHGGTSAAAPNAAGVFALALSVRPDLTWRDIQHLCVLTGQKINPEDPDWEATASGNSYSYKYGFGSLDGYEFVKAAQAWTLVKPQGWVELPTIQVGNGTVDLFESASGGDLIVSDGVQSTMMVTDDLLKANNFETLEHITIKVWITHTRRGDVEVELISPNGVKSVLAAKRRSDNANTGFIGWTFMTVKHWGENPAGEWTIRVSDQAKESEVGHFLGWTMSLWGAVIDPSNVKDYDVPLLDTVLPPLESNDIPPTVTTVPKPSASKTFPKPTSALPDDHGSSTGEASKPAFENGQASATTPVEDVVESSPASPTSTPTADEGWFAGLSSLVTNQVWFFVAAGAVVVFAIAVGIFFWRRAVRQRANYTSLPANETSMALLGSGARRTGGTKELYDAFGEVSDDEADEETGLQGGRPQSPTQPGFEGFLDDDDPLTASGATSATRYKDDPDRLHRPASPSSNGSGSWEHASETR